MNVYVRAGDHYFPWIYIQVITKKLWLCSIFKYLYDAYRFRRRGLILKPVLDLPEIGV